MPKIQISRRSLMTSVAGMAILSASGALARKHSKIGDLPTILVSPDKIDVRDGWIIIESRDLAESLKSSPEEALKLLRVNYKGLSASDVTVDRQGRVVVRNRAFTNNLTDRISKRAAGNGICGWDC